MILKKILDILMPARCLDCGVFVEDDYSICHNCWPKYLFIDDPMCKICGVPFPFEGQSEYICAGCAKDKPHFDIARSVFKYDGSSKKIIHGFKYNDRTYLAKFFAKIILSRFGPLVIDADIITCVPMHKFKRIFRLYNHSQILGREIAAFAKKNFSQDALIKTKNTKSQTFLSRSARKKNLIGSFASNPKIVFNKNVVIIDDVISTGQTINLCAKELKKAGAKKVIVLAIAKNYHGS
ncbi:MAG: ComF family protein [Rickettsiaceae bacterium]|nr:ComF family protein [Rickettsiaceae bacterium]